MQHACNCCINKFVHDFASLTTHMQAINETKRTLVMELKVDQISMLNNSCKKIVLMFLI